MIVLSIETSATVGGVALTRDRELLAGHAFEKGLVHGREIAPAIKKVAEAAGLSLGEIDLVAVDIGPGSYTGVRVGVSAAKTLAWALEIKLAAVVSLDALAEAAKHLGPTLVPVLDARRGQLYTATYKSENSTVSRVSGPAVMPVEGFIDTVARPAVLLGDAIAKFPDKLAADSDISHAPEDYWIPKAAVIAQLGERNAERGSHCEEVAQPLIKRACGPDKAISSRLANPVTLEPLYLRPSEAELKLGLRVDPTSGTPEKRQ